jgi:predicted ATPase/DNA-binding XRE family transcriptional regulator
VIAMGNGITFGGWVKQRRKELGITQVELAERLAFSSVMLWKMEADERRPSRQIAQLLADYFRVPNDEREAFITFARSGRAAYTPPSSKTQSDEDLARAPWRGIYLRQTNLPAILTPLLGREQEVAEARDLILRPKTRLLTFTGAPGIGKTRLALQVASELVEQFDHGAFFVDLAPVVDPDHVLPTVGRAIGLKEAGGWPMERVLVEFVRERRMLILMDNFEQVLDAATGVVRLMEASPWLKVLVTSREALRVRGERRFPVPPLPLPDLRQLPPAEELPSYASVELFVERAEEVLPHFQLTHSNGQDVAAVCVGLDGLPLAIELAAARADYLTPGQMQAELESRLNLVTTGARDLPDRQRTLRSAIEWSYALLSESEQRLFRSLSVFVGGCTLDAVEAVCAVDVPNLVWTLVDKNLLRQQEGVDGQLRFTMLETIREYALGRLHESGETATLQERHAAYFMRLAEEGEPELMGPQGAKWVEQLEREHDNLQAVLGGLLLCGSHEKAFRLAAALERFWYIRGYFTEGRMWIETILERASNDGPTLDRGDVHSALGHVVWSQGNRQRARALYKESLAIFRALGNKEGIARALHGLGSEARDRGDYAKARRYYEESLTLRRELGDTRGVSVTLAFLGAIAHFQGATEEAKSKLEESLAISRKINSKHNTSNALNILATIALDEGDLTQATALLEESLQIARELGWGVQVGYCLRDLGFVELQKGSHDRAKALYQESLSIGKELGAAALVVDTIVGMAGVAGAQGKAERAARLLGAVGTLQTTMGATVSPEVQGNYERILAKTRTKLDQGAQERARQIGRAMTSEAAIAYALNED